MPKRGEQAVFADPEGALFGVVKSSAGDPEDFLAEPGDWIWIQLLSRNAGKAAEFYRKVAGYEVIENAASNRVSDYVLSSKGYARATVRTIPARQQESAAHLAAVCPGEKRRRIGGAGQTTRRQGASGAKAGTPRRQGGGDRRSDGSSHWPARME